MVHIKRVSHIKLLKHYLYEVWNSAMSHIVYHNIQQVQHFVLGHMLRYISNPCPSPFFPPPSLPSYLTKMLLSYNNDDESSQSKSASPQLDHLILPWCIEKLPSNKCTVACVCQLSPGPNCFNQNLRNCITFQLTDVRHFWTNTKNLTKCSFFKMIYMKKEKQIVDSNA